MAPAIASRERLQQQLVNTQRVLTALARDDATTDALRVPIRAAQSPRGAGAEAGRESRAGRLAGLRRRLEEARARRADAAGRRSRSEGAVVELRRAVSAAERRVVRCRQRALAWRQEAFESRCAMEELRQRDLLDDAFRVDYQGPFGTINGCRLGRIARVGQAAVSWAEFNAALGHTALLVATVAKRLGVVLRSHRVIPMGSFTRICPHGGNESSAMKLHYDEHMLGQVRLNFGLRALAACVVELQQHAAPGFTLPYRVAAGFDSIGGSSLLMQMGSREVEWNEALRNLLASLKWLQAWALTQPEPS